MWLECCFFLMLLKCCTYSVQPTRDRMCVPWLHHSAQSNLADLTCQVWDAEFSHVVVVLHVDDYLFQLVYQCLFQRVVHPVVHFWPQPFHSKILLTRNHVFNTTAESLIVYYRAIFKEKWWITIQNASNPLFNRKNWSEYFFLSDV